MVGFFWQRAWIIFNDKMERTNGIDLTYARFNLKDTLSDKQLGEFWHFLLSEFTPAIQTIKGGGGR